MSNPWLAALVGLGETAIFLAFFIALSEGISYLAPLLLRSTRTQWKLLRVERFWLINFILAPIMLAFFALAIWLLRFTPTQVGFNFHNVGWSLGIALPLSLLMGGTSAVASVIAARSGITPMRGVPFGRTLTDVIGMISYMVILVGPLEEIPFRGIIQTLLDKDIPQSFSGIKLGTIIAAVIFVLYHYRNVTMGGESAKDFLRLAPGRIIVSLILALLFQFTGSLLGPILFHNIVDTGTIAALSITIYRLRQRGEWPPKQPKSADSSTPPTPLTPLNPSAAHSRRESRPSAPPPSARFHHRRRLAAPALAVPARREQRSAPDARPPA